MNIRLPVKRKKGGQKKGIPEKHIIQLQEFANDLKALQAGLSFHMSARGWCYIMEQYGLKKGDFVGCGESWIRECRVLGYLQPEFILDDQGHEVTEEEEREASDKEGFIEVAYSGFQNAPDPRETFEDSWWDYYCTTFWEDKDYYIQLLVEKVDLKSLFAGICRRHKIPLGNLKGWGSMEQKAVIAKNFQLAEGEGKKPILLVCADFDPAGLCISELLKGDFEEFSIFTGWDPKNLFVDRIGLGYNFIQENHLTWIENLESSKGKDMTSSTHPVWINNTYNIHEYVAKYGKRKCEANAIVIVPELGQKMLQNTIDKYLGEGAIDKFHEAIDTGQEEMKEALKQKMREEFDE